MCHVRRGRGLATFAVAAAVAGCGGTSSATRRAAHDQSGDARAAAELLAAVDAQHLDPAVAARALRSRSAPLRRLATIAIGQSRTPSLAPLLRDLMRDADTAVAANAAFAAGLLVDTASTAALSAALARGGGVAVEAAWSLGEIGEASRAIVVHGLRLDGSGGRSAPVTAQLLFAAAKLRPVPLAVVVPHIHAREGQVREAAAYALGRPRLPAGVRLLIPLADDSSEVTRVYVARGLARSAAGDSLGAEAFATLTRLLGDARPHVRISAVRSLATYPDRARAPVLAAARDHDANVRTSAAEAAGELAPQLTAADWAALWSADSAYGYRRALLAGAAPRRQLREQSARWAGDADWRRRAAAAVALGRSPDRVAAGGLETLVGDRDARVRAAAYQAVATRLDSADTPAALRDVVRAGLLDEDAVVRSVTTTALAGSPRVGEIGAIRAAYRRAAADRDNDARLAALRYLAKLWLNDSASVAGTDLEWLRQFPAPNDPLERVAAAGLPGTRAWAARAGSSRDISWYENVVREVWLPALASGGPRVTLRTERGDIELALDAAGAPLTTHNFISLIRRGDLGAGRFHRVVGGFVAQDGDPRGDGNGGPGYAIRDEHNRRRYERGVVGMALSGPNTGGSQYFIALSPQPHLDGHYTAFGRVTRGFDVLDQLLQGDSIHSVALTP